VSSTLANDMIVVPRLGRAVALAVYSSFLFSVAFYLYSSPIFCLPLVLDMEARPFPFTEYTNLGREKIFLQKNQTKSRASPTFTLEKS
jgi:hypothetical protein